MVTHSAKALKESGEGRSSQSQDFRWCLMRSTWWKERWPVIWNIRSSWVVANRLASLSGTWKEAEFPEDGMASIPYRRCAHNLLCTSVSILPSCPSTCSLGPGTESPWKQDGCSCVAFPSLRLLCTQPLLSAQPAKGKCNQGITSWGDHPAN